MSEVLAAQFLVDTLADYYGVKATGDPDVWQRYGRYMQAKWHLSDAETRVAAQCIRGLSNSEIAEALTLRPETVNKHLDTIYKKACVGSRSELAAALLYDVAKMPRLIF